MLRQQKFLMTASVIALVGLAVPANAQNQNEGRTPDTQAVTEQELEQGWENTGETASETADAAGELVEETVIEIRQALLDDETAMAGETFVNYNPRKTASSIIGSPVYSSNGTIVGDIEDILVDERGKAQYFVLSEGSVLGLGGRDVAFEYGEMASTSADGAVIAPVTEEMVERKEDYDPNIHAGHSLAKMLDGQILGAKGEAVASIDNIVLENGSATYIVAGFNKVLGLGGEETALAYGTGTFAVRDKEINVVLDSSQTANFKSFKNTATN